MQLDKPKTQVVRKVIGKVKDLFKKNTKEITSEEEEEE